LILTAVFFILARMETIVSEVLENILGLLALEGSFEVVEGPEEIEVTIEANDPSRLIGFRGETLDALQLIVNLIVSKQTGEEKFKRVIVDVGGWRKNKEADLERLARNWAQEVLDNQKPIELDPMPSWQRRIVHMVVSEIDGVVSESQGEGKDRHLLLHLGNKPTEEKTAEVEPVKTKVKKKAKVVKKKIIKD